MLAVQLGLGLQRLDASQQLRVARAGASAEGRVGAASSTATGEQGTRCRANQRTPSWRDLMPLEVVYVDTAVVSIAEDAMAAGAPARSRARGRAAACGRALVVGLCKRRLRRPSVRAARPSGHSGSRVPRARQRNGFPGRPQGAQSARPDRGGHQPHSQGARGQAPVGGALPPRAPRRGAAQHPRGQARRRGLPAAHLKLPPRARRQVSKGATAAVRPHGFAGR